MNSITTTELATLEGATVFDVREPFEYVGGHAPAAVNLPLSEFVDRVAEVPRDETVYIICESGGRSAQATQWLEDQGYRAVNVTGGTSAWRSAGLPVAMGA
jgi:rhodanese-related sulfurtransferase